MEIILDMPEYPLKVYNSEGFSIFAESCNNHHHLIFENFYHAAKKPHASLLSLHTSSNPGLSIPIDLPILDILISYKWNSITCDLL